MKPGWKTTEFWVTLATQVLAVLVTLGVITPEQQSVFSESAAKLAGAVTMAVAAFGYAISRGMAKKQSRNE